MKMLRKSTDQRREVRRGEGKRQKDGGEGNEKTWIYF